MAEVTEDQFKKDGSRLVHVPTGAKISIGSPFANFGALDDGSDFLLTADGQDFKKEDIVLMAKKLGAGDYPRPE